MDDPEAITKELISRAMEGDKQAIAHLYQRYEKEMIGMVHARLGHTLHGLMESVDLVQSVWKDLLDEIQEFDYRGPDSFSRWLRTCLINKIQGKRRYHVAKKRDAKKLNRMPHDDLLAADAPHAATDPTPSRVAMNREELDQLQELVNRFPNPQRRILILRMRDEMGFDEIAKKTGKSADAAKKMFQRSLQKLIEMLPEDWRQAEESG